MTYRMRVGYGKLGRVIPFDPGKWKFAGEAEAVNILYRLAERNPDVEWHVIGKSSGVPNGPPNIVTYWDEFTPKSAWGVSTTAPSGRMCNYCKQPAEIITTQLRCCERSREAADREDQLVRSAVSLDAMVIHLGQHGTSHNFIPKVGKTWDDPDVASVVRPYVWAFNYGGYLVRALNAFCDAHDGGTGRMVWLCADPRNYMNGRDIKWPTGTEREEPVLAQYNTVLNGVHERWRDQRSPTELGYFAKVEGGLWRVQHHYRHSGLDMAMLPDDWEDWPSDPFIERDPVGIISTSAYLPRREHRRSAAIADWVLSSFPDAPVHGKWDDRSLADLPEEARDRVKPAVNFEGRLASFRCTAIFPPTPQGLDGMKWCTAKPWQAMAARAVAFMIPPVDAQGWVIPVTAPQDGLIKVGDGLWSCRDDWTGEELHLARWLRPKTPEALAQFIRSAGHDESVWEWLVNTQLGLLRRRWAAAELETSIERRLKLR